MHLKKTDEVPRTISQEQWAAIEIEHGEVTFDEASNWEAEVGDEAGEYLLEHEASVFERTSSVQHQPEDASE